MYVVAFLPREGKGWMKGGCRPIYHPAVSATTVPCGRDDVPAPTGVPGCAAARALWAARAGRRSDVESTRGGRERSTGGHGRG